jgi:hypothetical protein
MFKSIIIIICNHVLDPSGSVTVSSQHFLGLPRLLRPLWACDRICLGNLSGSILSTCVSSIEFCIVVYSRLLGECSTLLECLRSFGVQAASILQSISKISSRLLSVIFHLPSRWSMPRCHRRVLVQQVFYRL